jgi:SAM-dependent methyltransferase
MNVVDLLAPYRERLGRRYKTFLTALSLLPHNPHILETGCTRFFGDASFVGDGCSTFLFGGFVSAFGGHLTSVDVDANAIKLAGEVVVPFHRCVSLFCCDSVAFLQMFRGSVNLLYLDSFDYHDGQHEASQAHNLREVQAALPRLAPSGLILFDDCDCPNGGKPGRSLPFLVEAGWRIIEKDYAVLLAR